MPFAEQRIHPMHLAAKRLLAILQRLEEGRLSDGFLLWCAQVGVHKAALAVQAACKRSLAQMRLRLMRCNQVAVTNASDQGAVTSVKAGVEALGKLDGQWHIPHANAATQTEEPVERLLDQNEQSRNGAEIVYTESKCTEECLVYGFHHGDCSSGTSAALVGPLSSRLQNCPGWKVFEALVQAEEDERLRRDIDQLSRGSDDSQWSSFKSSTTAKPPSPYLQPARPGSLKQSRAGSSHKKPPRPRQASEGPHRQSDESGARHAAHGKRANRTQEPEDLVPKPRYG